MSRDENVNDVLERLSNEHYLNNILAIACVTVRKDDGEIEMQIGMPFGTAYRVLAALEILKANIIRQIMDDAEIPPKERDI